MLAQSANSAVYKAKWVDGGIRVTVNAPEDGTAYVLVQGSGDAEPSASEVTSSGTSVSCTADTDASVSVAVSDTGAKDVYVKFVPSDSSSSTTYQLMKMTLPAKTESTSTVTGDGSTSGSVSYSAVRSSADSITLSVTPTQAGKTYYIVKNANAGAPNDDDFTDASLFDCAASSTTTETINVDDSSEKVVYLKYKVGDTWYEGISSLTVPAYQTSSVDYSAEWSDSTHIQLTVNPTDGGTAYYVVQEQGSTAPSADSVVSSGTQLVCSADTDNSATFETTSTAKTIYVVYKSGDTKYKMTSLSLPAYSSGEVVVKGDATTLASVSLKAERTSSTTINLDATPTTAGVVHYIVQDADADAPSLSDVLASDDTIVCDTANETASTTVTTDSAAKTIYLAFVTSDGVASSNMEVMEVPAYGTAAYGAKILEYDPDFGTASVGYSSVSAKTFTIENTGANSLTFSVKSGSDNFTVSLGDSGTSLTVAAGETGTFTIQPKTGLAAGTYSATITLSGANADGAEVLALDVPVSFTVAEAEAAGQYYEYEDSSFPWSLMDADTDEVAYSPVYCINKELWIGPDGYDDKIYFNGYLDVTADQFERYAGNGYTYDSDTGTYTYYKADADGDGNLEVATSEETLENVKRVLNNGYGGANEDQNLRSYIEESIGGASLSGDDADLAFWAATQAAIWHYTDYSYGSTTSTVYGIDQYMLVLGSNNGQISRWWNNRPRIHAAIEAVYNALIDEDGVYPETTFYYLGTNTFPGGTLVTDTSDVEANVFENTLEPSSTYLNGHYQNLINATSTSAEDETTSVSMTKVWNDGGTTTATGRPSATEFASWLHLYANGTEVTGYTPTVTDNQDGTYTVTYSGLPRTDSDGNTLSYSIEEEVPSDSTYSYSAEYSTTSGGENKTVTGTYVAHRDDPALSGGVHRIWMSDPDYGDEDQVVYCFNIGKTYPNVDNGEDDGYEDGTTYTTKITNATNDQFKQYADNESVDDLRSAVLSVVYNGYPTNAAGLQGSLTDDQFRVVTQLAIYHFTDNRTYTSSSFDSTEEYEVYQKLISGDEGVAAGDIAAVPENYGLTLYVSSSGGQNLLSGTGGESTVTNTQLTSVEFTKKWVGSDGTGKEATIHLYRSVAGGDAEDTGLSITVDGAADTTLATGSDEYANATYGEDSAWHGTFDNLPAFDSDGNAYTYTIVEDTVDGFYEAIISGDATTGFTVTNISDETRDIRAVKTWKGTSQEVTVNLLADGVEIESVTLDGTVDALTTDNATGIVYGEASSWVASFGYLPKYDETDGHEIAYTVTEDSIDGVTTAIGDATTVSSTVTEYAITNTRTGTVRPTVTKSWAEGVTSAEVTLQLQRYDTSTSTWEEVESITLDGTADDGVTAGGTETGEYASWQGRFSAADKYDSDGNEYSYQVVETTTGEWVASYSGTLAAGFTVTNNAQSAVSATLSAKKTLNNAAPGDYSFTFNLYQADENGDISDETPIQSVTNSSDGTITFNALSFSSADDYYYVIKEVDAGQSGITYDSDAVVAHVSVTSDSSGALSAAVTYKKGDATEFTSEVPTFANTRSTTYTSVGVTKSWVGGTDGSVTVKLYRTASTGETEEYATLTLDGKIDDSLQTDAETGVKFGEDAAWHGTFQNLPASDSNGTTYTYTVKEVDSEGNETDNPVDGYLSSISGNASIGYVITNTKLTSISFEKKWNDDGLDHDSDDAVTVQLQKYNSSTSAWENVDGKVITLDGTIDSSGETSAWHGSFTDLPTYESDGTTAIQYRVVETSGPSNYIYDGVTGNMSEGFVLTNTLETSLTVTKEWVGSDGTSATFQLYRSVKGGTAEAVSGKTLTLTSSNWTGSFTDLPAYDSDGNLYTYSVQETDVVGSNSYVVTYGTTNVNTVTAQTQTVTNTEATQVSVTKDWYGGTSTPVTINLMKQVGSGSATIAATIKLNGVADTSTTTNDAGITMKEDEAWHAVFGNLPTMENGETVTYTVEEASVPSGFTSPDVTGDASSGFTIKNISTVKTNVEVTKVWKGTSEAVTINLYQDGTLYKTVTLDGTVDDSMTTDSDGVIHGEPGSWVAEFVGLPKYNPTTGAEYTYTVKEESVDETTTTGETSATMVSDTLTSYTITNTRSATIQPTVTKAWDTGVTSGEVTFGLYVGDSTNPVDTVTLDGEVDSNGESTAWVGTFDAVQKYDSNGALIDYQVREITTGDYNCAVTEDSSYNFTATNTNKAVASLSAAKTLDGAAPTDGKTFTFELYEGSSATGTPIQTKQSTSGGAVTFDDLTFDEAGTYTYTIHEKDDGQAYINYDLRDVVATITVSGEEGSFETSVTYTKAGSTVSSATFENTTVTEDVLDVVATKTWDGASGTEATFALYRSTDGTAVTDDTNTAEFTGYTVTLDGTADASFTDAHTVQFGETGAWVATFKNLPKTDSQGDTYTYSVLEVTASGSSWVPVTNYKASYGGSMDAGFTVTNSQSEETVSIPVQKEWADGAQGDHATIELVENGEKTGKTVTLDESNNWQDSFDDLPKYDSSGNEITYTVTEDTAVWNYTVQEDGNGGFIVTNKPSIETVDIPVQKKWADGASGDEAVIELVKNGEATGQTITLNEDNGWKGTFSDLPKYDNNGNEIEYSVTEQTSEWNYTVASDGNGGFIVTNYPKDTTVTPGNGNSSKSGSGNMPKTGDSTPSSMLALLAAAGLSVAAFGLHRRRNDA